MISQLTTVGLVRAIIALVCIVVGTVQLLRPKHGAAHRACGYAFAYGMVVVGGAAILLYRFTGSFNAFHFGAIVNLVAIICAMVPMLMSPRPTNWRLLHYRFMAGAFIGLMAAAATQLAIRIAPLAGRGQAWVASAVVAGIVTWIGVVLVRRYRPPSVPLPPGQAAIQPDGVTP